MTKRSDADYLRHILDAIDKIERYASGLDENSFVQNPMAHDAVIRQLEIIGEAAKKIKAGLREKSAHIPWRAIAGTRDVLIHQYFGIDLKQIWDVVKRDLPHLKREVEALATAETP